MHKKSAVRREKRTILQTNALDKDGKKSNKHV